MRIRDKILYKRLERIREKLNFYIADKSKDRECEISMPIERPVLHHSGKVEKQISSPMVCHMYVPSSPKTTITPSEIHIPDWLCTEGRKKSIEEVLENKAETFSTMLLRLIDEKGLKDSDAYKRANIDRRLFSKIRGDEDYIPSKKTAISFCLALQLTMDEAKKLLETAGYALSTSTRFDLIIMYLIENREYNIHFANIVLEDYGEGTLSK